MASNNAASPLDPCMACKEPLSRRLRCTQCLVAVYCSPACQKRHWKVHRLPCRAARAHRELSSLVSSSSLTDAQNDKYLAEKQIESLSNEEETTKFKAVSSTAVATTTSSSTNRRFPTVPSRNNNSQSPITRKETETESVLTSFGNDRKDSCSFVVEDLSNLSCYNLRLRFPPDAVVSCGSLLVQLKHRPSGPLNDEEFTILAVAWGDDTPVEIEFPGHVTEATTQPMDDSLSTDDIMIRLSYRPESKNSSLDATTVMSKRMPTAAATTLACRSCNHPLISSDVDKESDDDNASSNRSATIRSVMPLPSSRWDDMMDYLTCYPGEASVTFNSAVLEGQRGRMLEDETTLLAHANDVNACVMHSLPGYGQMNDGSSRTDALASTLDGDASFRGDRPWKDSVAGSTVTCPCCATILGASPSPTTIRFLKHRLSVTYGSTRQPLVNVSVFLAHEMIRYAENKAIFVFRVQQSSSHKCLVLRLISWDNVGAVSEYCRKSNDDAVYQLQWRRMFKVIFEEDVVSKADSANVWMWTDDLCCQPVRPFEEEKRATPSTSASAVQLALDEEEWKLLYEELVLGADFIHPDVQKATAMTRTGSDTARLSTIFVQ
jgi:hypothetical protein